MAHEVTMQDVWPFLTAASITLGLSLVAGLIAARQVSERCRGPAQARHDSAHVPMVTSARPH